jgi:hypothetical protein
VSALRSTGREEGQTVVEFALILFPLLILVAGIIQFGIAVNFWQDQQRLAAQGARSAIVNCAAAQWCTPTLEQYLESQPLSNGNNPDATVCFESMSGSGLDAGKAVVGDQITVYLETPFSLVPIFGVGDITLSARTTMRLEQKPTHPGISGAVLCT